MNPYQLTPQAANDLREIVAWLSEHLGEDAAFRAEGEFFEKFELLADFPGLGSQRPDLTRHPFHFFLHVPYFIVYMRRTDPLLIHGILHTARDLRRIFRGRKSSPDAESGPTHDGTTPLESVSYPKKRT